ncbi:PREDICTED: uncharacterized protein LOC108781418 [Cyphomyrmex costatus]|uniref:uncharacterized protein LOC108781418 n=1 Tax=Cyphomyrmex costatus TaxID=456900 RepID=UPI00085241C6|nr:PREDICTED: uncharacterized protein LOC108781418 [Cyphomyrmex costatus]
MGQISGLSKGNLAMRSRRGSRIEDEELMDLIGERELHFNVTVSMFQRVRKSVSCGFHEGKNPEWRSSARRASKTDGVFAINFDPNISLKIIFISNIENVASLLLYSIYLINVEIQNINMSLCPRRRFRITPMRALAAFFLMVVLFWYSLSRQEIPQQPCSVPEEFTEKLHDLAYRAHLVLTKLGIVHFLCLGGLWGQVRIGRALPWARKVELCLVDTLRDDVLITKAFREVGLSATYLHAAGIYRIQEHEVGEDAPKVEVVVFEEDAVTQMVRRVGWTRRVLPPDCEFSPSLQCFPPQLVIPPLPTKQFGGRLMPVPREGIELQKYHYPNDWWLEIKPTDCTELQETNV